MHVFHLHPTRNINHYLRFRNTGNEMIESDRENLIVKQVAEGVLDEMRRRLRVSVKTSCWHSLPGRFGRKEYDDREPGWAVVVCERFSVRSSSS